MFVAQQASRAFNLYEFSGLVVVTADNRSYRATIQRDAEKSRPVRRLGVCCDVVGEGRRLLLAAQL
jgi:hypothetical protein